MHGLVGGGHGVVPAGRVVHYEQTVRGRVQGGSSSDVLVHCEHTVRGRRDRPWTAAATGVL